MISSVFKRTNLKIGTVCKVEDNAPKKWEKLYESNQDGYFFYERFKKDPGLFVKNRLLDIGSYLGLGNLRQVTMNHYFSLLEN